MSSTAGSALLSANSGAQDRPLTSQVDNIFTSTRVFKHAPVQKEYIRIGPNNTLAYANPIRFKLPRIADFSGPIIWEWITAAATSTGATGSNPRHVDWYGFALIDLVKVRFASQALQEFRGDDLFCHHLLFTPSDMSLAEAVGGGLSAADRNTNATTAGHETLIPLSLLFWASRTADYLPINSEMLREDLDISITTRTVFELLETDGSDIAQTITSGDLLVEYIHVGDEVQVAMLDEASAANADANIQGYSRLVCVQNHQDEAIANAVTQQSFELGALNNPLKELIFYVRDDSDIPSATAVNSAADFYNFQQVSTHTLEGFSNTINIAMTDKFSRIIEKNRFHSGPIGSEYLYARPFGYAPEASDQYGYLNFSSISNRKLKVTMNSSWASTGDLHMIGQAFNWYMVTPDGNLRMFYNIA